MCAVLQYTVENDKLFLKDIPGSYIRFSIYKLYTLRQRIKVNIK